ncbi:MAG: dipeptidase [Oscillospiraceae bacterium]|nr:dipeptidase [Oscillospiraceae bacterium]
MDLFDGHCDTLLHCYETGAGLCDADGHWNLRCTKKFRRQAQFFALFADDTLGRPLEEVIRAEYVIFQRELALHPDRIRQCRTGAEAVRAAAEGRTAAFLSVEGGELLGCDITQLDWAHAIGVRAVNLTWNRQNALSGSHMEGEKQGLTAQGRNFVRRMEELGMLVDVSHLSDPGFWDVAEEIHTPLFASHSNSRSVFFHTRNLTDRQFTAIIDSKGVAGINFFSDFLGVCPDTDTVIAHIEHFWSLGGEKHVAIGGDWDGCARLPRCYSGVWDLERLYEALLRRNYSGALLEDLFYNNMLRVVSEVCTM